MDFGPPLQTLPYLKHVQLYKAPNILKFYRAEIRGGDQYPCFEKIPLNVNTSSKHSQMKSSKMTQKESKIKIKGQI